jgi:hypothetical protein
MADQNTPNVGQLDYLSRHHSNPWLQLTRLLSRVALLTLSATCFGPALLRFFLPDMDLSAQDVLSWNAVAAACVIALAALGLILQRKDTTDLRPKSQYGMSRLVVYSLSLLVLEALTFAVCRYCEPFCQAYFIKLYGPCARWYEGTRVLRSELGGGLFSLTVALLTLSNLLLTTRRVWRDRHSRGFEFRSCIALPAAWLAVLGELMLLFKYGIVQAVE